MKILGIIVEYNPFHNGHTYHLNEAKKITNADFVVAIMSGNVVQRGEFAIIDKYRRTKVALEQGVDLLIELPAIYSLQSAKEFSAGAIKLLNYAGITDLVFGSETNNLTYLRQLAELEINLDNLKEIMKSGISYPKALGQLTDSLYPNDILAVSYLRELKKYPHIKAHLITRTNSYHGLDLVGSIVSASAIRNALYCSNSFANTTVMEKELLKYHNFNDYYFEIIKYSLITQNINQLNKYLLVSEGIERHLIKQILNADNYQDFLNKAITKRYTKVKIQRTLINIILKIKKTDKYLLEKTKHLRILGFNQKARQLLKIFKENNISYSVKYKKIPKQQKELTMKITLLYQLFYQDKKLENYEVKFPIIK